MARRDYGGILRRYWKVIVAASLIGAVLGGALGVVLRPAVPVPVYTATVQSVLLTPQALADYHALLEREQAFTATTSVLIQIPSPSGMLTDQEFTDLRIAFYRDILLTETVLASLTDATGLTPSELRNRVRISNPDGTGLVHISVSDPNEAQAQQLSEALVAELARRVTGIETGSATVENLGTIMTAPSLSTEASAAALSAARADAVQQVIAADPLAVADGAAAAIPLFGDSEFQRLSQALSMTRSPEQWKAFLTLTTRGPEIPPAAESTPTEEGGSILVSATDADAGTATAIATEATTLLQERIAVDRGFADAMDSPLVVASSTVTDAGLTTGADPAFGGTRTRVNIVLGLLIGMAAGVGYALFRAGRDFTIRNVGQLREFTGRSPVWVLDAVTTPASDCLAVSLDSTHESESFRAIRTNLMFGLPDARVLTITSAGGDQGAEVGINLASTFQQAGESVILVEADLRGPRVAAALSLNGREGLISVLEGACSFADAVQFWEMGGLSVLSAEHAVHNPSDLLSGRRFGELLDELRDRFAYVVVTTPPVLGSTDAAVVASRSDAVLLLLRHGQTTTLQLEAAITALDQVAAHLASVVVTDVPPGEVNAWQAAGGQRDESNPDAPARPS